MTIAVQTLEGWELLFPKHWLVFAVHQKESVVCLCLLVGFFFPLSCEQGRTLLCSERYLVWQWDMAMAMAITNLWLSCKNKFWGKFFYISKHSIHIPEFGKWFFPVNKRNFFLLSKPIRGLLSSIIHSLTLEYPFWALPAGIAHQMRGPSLPGCQDCVSLGAEGRSQGDTLRCPFPLVNVTEQLLLICPLFIVF